MCPALSREKKEKGVSSVAPPVKTKRDRCNEKENSHCSLGKRRFVGKEAVGGKKPVSWFPGPTEEEKKKRKVFMQINFRERGGSLS